MIDKPHGCMGDMKQQKAPQMKVARLFAKLLYKFCFFNSLTAKSAARAVNAM